MKDKKLAVQILVPVAIAAVIVGIWFIRNTAEKVAFIISYMFIHMGQDILNADHDQAVRGVIAHQ